MRGPSRLYLWAIWALVESRTVGLQGAYHRRRFLIYRALGFDTVLVPSWGCQGIHTNGGKMLGFENRSACRYGSLHCRGSQRHFLAYRRPSSCLVIPPLTMDFGAETLRASCVVRICAPSVSRRIRPKG